MKIKMMQYLRKALKYDEDALLLNAEIMGKISTIMTGNVEVGIGLIRTEL